MSPPAAQAAVWLGGTEGGCETKSVEKDVTTTTVSSSISSLPGLSLPDHSWTTAVRPLPPLIVLRAHESEGGSRRKEDTKGKRRCYRTQNVLDFVWRFLGRQMFQRRLTRARSDLAVLDLNVANNQLAMMTNSHALHEVKGEFFLKTKSNQ